MTVSVNSVTVPDRKLWQMSERGEDPEHDEVLADSVSGALLAALETLSPAEQMVFVLHEVFAVSFEEIGTIIGRSPAATRQLARKARVRVRGSREAV